MSKEEFRQLCKTAWEKQHGFVIIDLSSRKHDGKYRSGCDEFYIPNWNQKLLLFPHLKMEDLLKKIVNNNESKRSFSIVVSDNKTRFKTWFKPPIQLGKNKNDEIALINLKRITHFQI